MHEHCVISFKYIVISISGETMSVKEQIHLPELGVCTRCNFASSQEVCKACVLLEGLNKGLPRLGIGKSSKVKRILEEHKAKLMENCKDSNNKCCGTGRCKKESSKDLVQTNNHLSGVESDNKTSSKAKIILSEFGLDSIENGIDKMTMNTVNELEEDDPCSGGCGRVGF